MTSPDHAERQSSALEARTAHHFGSFETQRHAMRFGMWLFLATEVLLFGGLFVAYSVYRSVFHEAFQAASRHLDLTLGTVNTVVLITSSFTVAIAIHFMHHDKKWPAAISLLSTIAMACAFLVIKSFEYAHKFEEGALPGQYYHFHEVQIPGAAMFFTLYFIMTGLHAIHVIIGILVLGFLMIQTVRNRYAGGYDLPLELGGLYWHLVDLVWIFLFPLLYLI